MTDSNVFNLTKPEQNDPLQEVLREGAPRMLAAAIEAEVGSFIERYGLILLLMKIATGHAKATAQPILPLSDILL